MGGRDGSGNRREGHTRLRVDHDGVKTVLGDSGFNCPRQGILVDLVAVEIPLVGDVGQIEVAGNSRLPVLGADHLDALEETGTAAGALRNTIRLNAAE